VRVKFLRGEKSMAPRKATPARKTAKPVAKDLRIRKSEADKVRGGYAGPPAPID